MTKDIEHIQNYYSPSDLYNNIIRGLKQLGTDLSKVTLDDLQPVDEFHIRGDVATKELIELAEFSSDMHILDMGCGIGGSTRRLAYETGCRVTGIDLSLEYIDVAQRLTTLLNLQEQVAFHACSALALPFDANSFDGAWSLQMNMNVDDKLAWLKEIYRVLKPGGRAVLYEVCGNESVPLYFPLPWAQNSSMSFLVPPELLRELILSAGFDIAVWRNKTDQAKKAFAHVTEPKGAPKMPALGVYLLVGKDIQTKAYNLHRNLDKGAVSLIESLIVKPNNMVC